MKKVVSWMPLASTLPMEFGMHDAPEGGVKDATCLLANETWLEQHIHKIEVPGTMFMSSVEKASRPMTSRMP